MTAEQAKVLPDRLFRRLDRARLDPTLTQRALTGAWPLLKELVRVHQRFQAEGDCAALGHGAQRLIDHFSEEFVLQRKLVALRDEARPHRRRNGRIVYEVHGKCRMHGKIEVYVRTAAFTRPVALKSLLQTLLHEFVHHYDFDSFGASVHCSGFYERLGQLYRPLREGCAT